MVISALMVGLCMLALVLLVLCVAWAVESFSNDSPAIGSLFLIATLLDIVFLATQVINTIKTW